MNKTTPPKKISRSKIELFFECQRCFYLDFCEGISRPATGGFSLNLKIDSILKNEYDRYRKEQTIPPLVKKYRLNLLPFVHPQLRNWRDPFLGGLSFLEPTTNLILYGAPDDIWQDPDNQKLIVVDYKASTLTSPKDSDFSKSYQRQLEIYTYLLSKNGFDVAGIGYLLYCITNSEAKNLDSGLQFSQILVPCQLNLDWIENCLQQIIQLCSKDLPPYNSDCFFCKYLTKIEKMKTNNSQISLF